MRINVVSATLRIVLNHEDKRVIFVAAVGDLLDQQSNRVVVVGHLQLRRVHTQNGFAKVSRVVVHESDQRQIWKSSFSKLDVEFPLPLLAAVKIRKSIVEAAKINIGELCQRGIRWIRHLGMSCRRIEK